MAFGFGFGMPRSFAVPPFSPASLFASGAPGTWYDPSDINLNWRYNLLTYTEQFDNAVWVKTGATGASATKISSTTSGTFQYLQVIQTQSKETASRTYVATIEAKEAELRYLGVTIQEPSSGTNGVFTHTDLRDGSQINQGTFGSGFTLGSVQRTLLSDGYCKLVITVTTNSNATVTVGVQASKNSTFSNDAYIVGEGVLVRNASLTTVANASLPYQQIITPEISYLNYQPQPILYQDSAGTTPVTAVEQPVGLMLDKSQGLVLGPQLVTNGTFNSGTTGWSPNGTATPTLSVVSGELRVSTSSAALQIRAVQTLTLISGKTYKVTGITRRVVGDNTFLRITSSSDGSSAGQVAFSVNTATSNTEVQLVFTATAATLYLVLGVGVNSGTANLDGFFDNISVKELPGNHAFQSTAASRPVMSARYNLLTKTEQFDDAVWVKTGFLAFGSGSVANSTATLDPLNGNTADLLVENSSTSLHDAVSANIVGQSGASYTLSRYVKAGSGSRWFLLTMSEDASGGQSCFGHFQPSTNTVGVIGTSGAQWTSVSFTRTDVGNGWYKLVLTATLTSAANVTDRSRFKTTDNGPSSYTGDGTSSMYWWGADLRVSNNGITQPVYQSVNTSTDYNTVGFLPYLKFDGVDDSLSTNSINFTSTDKMSVFAGVRKLSDAAVGVIAELSASAGGGTSGTFVLHGQTSPVGYRYAAGSGPSGTAFATDDASVFTAPITNVVTGISNFAGATLADEISVRVNGVAPTQTLGGVISTGNFGNYPLFIGRRGGSSLPFNGQLYSMIIVGKAVTAGELTSTETYTASKTGVTLA